MPDLSVVVPVHNERDNFVPLLTEIAAALRGNAAAKRTLWPRLRALRSAR